MRTNKYLDSSLSVRMPVRWLSLPLLSLALSGCVWISDTSDLQSFVDQTQSRPSGKIEPLPEFKPYESFVYRGASLRDPFQPLVPVTESARIEGDQTISPDTERAKDYLESFPIDQLQMVGTITRLEEGRLMALVKDTNGEIHPVKVGDHMGLDYGEVMEVTDREIELSEIVSNGRGGWMKRPRKLALSMQD